MLAFVGVRGYNLIGRIAILHIVSSGSSPDTSIAREAQLVEQNLEAVLVVSSTLTMGIWDFSIMVNACDF